MAQLENEAPYNNEQQMEGTDRDRAISHIKFPTAAGRGQRNMPMPMPRYKHSNKWTRADATAAAADMQDAGMGNKPY